MISYRIVLDKRRIKSGNQYPVIIRVTQDRKVCNFYTGISLAEDEWDINKCQIVSKNPNYKELTHLITHKFLLIQNAILKLEESGEFSFEALKDKLQDKPKVKPVIIGFKALQPHKLLLKVRHNPWHPLPHLFCHTFSFKQNRFP